MKNPDAIVIGAGVVGACSALSLANAGLKVLVIDRGAVALNMLARIDSSGFDKRLAAVEITIASDVNNPLCGATGASAIFGPQKGATPEQVKILDAALEHFAKCCAEKLGTDASTLPGAGAAGGLGFAALAWMGAKFRPGVEVVAEIGGLAAAVQGASLVITGEGRMDAQTLLGKTPMGVATIARHAGVPVVAIAGSLGKDYQALYAAGIHAAFSLVAGPCPLEEACKNAPALLEERGQDIMRLWLSARHNVI